MTKYYFNFTDSFFDNEDAHKAGVKARACIECDTYKQVEELERNARWANKKAGFKQYKRMIITYKPIKNAKYFRYEDYTKLHDDRN